MGLVVSMITFKHTLSMQRPKASNGAHSVVFSHNRTVNIFTQIVEISQKPYRTSGAPYQDLDKCAFTKSKEIEYLVVSELDVLYLLCLVPRTADSQGPK